jgi:hypothetical protein
LAFLSADSGFWKNLGLHPSNNQSDPWYECQNFLPKPKYSTREARKLQAKGVWACATRLQFGAHGGDKCNIDGGTGWGDFGLILTAFYLM